MSANVPFAQLRHGGLAGEAHQNPGKLDPGVARREAFDHLVDLQKPLLHFVVGCGVMSLQ